MISNRFLTTILLLFFIQSFAQKKTKTIQLILSELKTSKEDTARANLYNKICKYYLKTNIDSVNYYANKGILLSRKLKYREGEMMSLNALGNYFENKSDFSKALETYDQALVIAKKNNSNKGFATIYNNIGMIYIKQGKYDIALDLMIKALEAEEKLQNNKGIAQSYNNIGVIYYYQQNLKKSTEYFEKSLAQEEKIGDKEAVIQAINNLGAIYDYMGENEKALNQYKKALKINTDSNNKREISTNLLNIALSYYKLKNHPESKKYYNQSINLRKQLGDYNALAIAYLNYGDLLKENKQNIEAEKYYKTAIQIAEKNDLKEIKKNIFGSLAELYASEKKFELSNEYLKKQILVKDSIFDSEKTKAIAETEIKYQTEKKEKDLAVAKNNLLKEEIKTKRKNILLIISLIIISFGIIISFLIYRTLKLRNKQQKQEYELTSAISKIENQNKLQEQRLSISRDLHDNIGAQLTFIISSVETLKRAFNITDEKISSRLSSISDFTRDTITELRDTIWAMNLSEIDFSEIRSRILNFVEKAQKSNEHIHIHFERDPELDQLHFSSVEGMNIYRITQEAVNNAMKYSGAKNILLTARKIEEYIEITIKDDGKGFEMDKTEPGNGIHNMQKRAAEINASITINSKTGNGTSIVLKIPKS